MCKWFVTYINIESGSSLTDARILLFIGGTNVPIFFLQKCLFCTHLAELLTDFSQLRCLGRTRWVEDSMRRKPTWASLPTSTSGTGNYPSTRSTTWPPATAERRRATSSPGQRTTLKYLAEQPNGPLSLAVRTTELWGEKKRKPEEKRKKKASPYF